LLDVRHPQDMRGPRCRLEPYGVSGTSPRFMAKSLITNSEQALLAKLLTCLCEKGAGHHPIGRRLPIDPLSHDVPNH
jgi:hypothetical protein